MDKESENENSLYSEIVKNLSGLMSDVMPENDSSKCEGTEINIQTNMNHGNQQTKHEKSQQDIQQQNSEDFNQLQILSRQNQQLQCLKIYAYIQQLAAINQLYLQQNLQQFKNSCYVWSGPIPKKSYDDAIYSKKIFLGGIPWNFDDNDVKKMFDDIGPIEIDWPVDENNHKVKGFTYVTFESEQEVKKLLDTCKKKGTYHQKSNSFFHRIVNCEKQKMIEIVPWRISDACYINCRKEDLDTTKTAFIGGLHGKLTADALALIMNDLFGGVAFIGIDVDEHNYPKGAGRVIFNNQSSYMHAVTAKFIQIKSGMIQKKIQIDPFVQDSLCSSCGYQRGKYFCRDVNCFCYFCCQCWNIRHSMNINFQGHEPLTRNTHSQQQTACNDTNFAQNKKNPIKPFVKPNEGNKAKATTSNKSSKKKSDWTRKTKK